MKYRFKDLQIGQGVVREFPVTEQMGQQFAQLSGDFNPIHFDEDYAGKTMFEGKIAHGMLVGGFISGVLGNDFPGEGTIYLKQDLKFLRPVRYGDTIQVRVTIAEKDEDRFRLKLSTDCYNQKEELVVEGMALVMLKDEEE